MNSDSLGLSLVGLLGNSTDNGEARILGTKTALSLELERRNFIARGDLWQ